MLVTKLKEYFFFCIAGKIGMRSIYYYGTTTITAVVLGITLVLIIQPGSWGGTYASDDEDLKVRIVTTADTLLDLIR